MEAARQEPSNPAPQAASPYRAVLNRYCVTCHNEKLKTAGLMLDKMNLENVTAGAGVWEKVIRKLRTGAMPPAGMPRPDKATYNSFAAYLETELDRAAEANPNPGRPSPHRLNRAEYANAVRDLLEVEIDAESLLPADDAGYGFDNIGDVLTVSPLLLERYLSAGRRISRLALGDSAMRPVFETYEIPFLLTQEDRVSDALPLGSRGGIAIRHYFPLDGEYTLKIRLQRTGQDRIMGLAERHQLEVRLDGARIRLFTVGGDRDGKTGAALAAYERTADAGLEVRFTAMAGTRTVGVAFLKETAVPEGVLQPRLAALSRLVQNVDPGVGRVTIGGPYDAKGPGVTASRRKILACRPANGDEQACGRKIITALARRAYRRPLTERDIQPLMRLYNEGLKDGGFESGIGMAIEGILISPKFLFRTELDPPRVAPGAAYAISDLELASRLSFFLWSSLPDNELLDVAERGRLREPAVLEQQVRRMLAHPRAKTLVSNFAGQWLYLRNLRSATADEEVFPEFDENLRQAFQRETELFFESTLREDRSIVELLNADYTFLNERLARHYGIPNIYGSQFRRVQLSAENRRGLLGHGSVLMVTSYANRTSPTLRGKWLLENILGTPPPPPPPNAPSLQNNGKDGKVLSMRERMELHRANPACATCHSRMDPLGFALENFDAIGKWRTTSEANTPIDSSGALPDGTKFDGPAELRKILLSHPEEFVATVTERLLTYALGRGLEYHDMPAIRKIMRQSAASDYRWSAIILGIVKSTPFQMRRSGEL